MKVNYKFIFFSEKVTPVIFSAVEEYITQKGVTLVKDSDGMYFNKEFIDVFYETDENVETETNLPDSDHPCWVNWNGRIVHLDEGDFIKFKNGTVSMCYEPFLLNKNLSDIDGFMKKENFKLF